MSVAQFKAVRHMAILIFPFPHSLHPPPLPRLSAIHLVFAFRLLLVIWYIYSNSNTAGVCVSRLQCLLRRLKTADS